MTTITITLDGLTELKRSLANAPRVIEEETTGFVNSMARGGESKAKDLVGTKTHRLERSITALPGVWAGGRIAAAWGTNVSYARMHEDGTPPHFIMPRRKKALRWMSGGKEVFARRVYHPGTKPRHYMKGSYLHIKSLVDRNSAILQARIVQRISAGGG